MKPIVAVSVFMLVAAGASGEILLKEDFEETPRILGWMEQGSWFGAEVGPSKGLEITDKVAISGKRCLQFNLTKGEKSSGGLMRFFKPSRRLYIRYYRMFEKEWEWPEGYGPHDSSVYAFKGPRLKGGPTSADFYTHLDFTQKADTILRISCGKHDPSWVRKARCPRYNRSKPDKIEPMQWHCVEMMLQMASPDTDDGEIRLWVNGKLVTEHVGIPLRSHREPDLPLKLFFISNYFHPGSPKDQTHWIDDLVISTEYIGTREQPVNRPPRARFRHSRDWGSMTAKFDASRSSDPDGSPLRYAWHFGDGKTAAGETASHAYAKEGEYAVELSVTDDKGVTHLTEHRITVGRSAGSGEGLRVDFYGGTKFQSEPHVVAWWRENINHQRKGYSGRYLWPMLGNSRGTDYSARWTGFVQPTKSEEYKLTYEVCEGGAVWFDGRLVIDLRGQPAGNKVLTKSASVGKLDAGRKYPIKLELFKSPVDQRGPQDWRGRLFWESPSTKKEPIPASAFYPPEGFTAPED
ncbi:MAG: PKD domain-containing protein [Planctomycetes bacterium]|nr:PKD domain-containing protein [Planctomycetota bacterium]MBL7037063.1 PKD domain-containing protein [Pirellulaceae bacterium]